MQDIRSKNRFLQKPAFFMKTSVFFLSAKGVSTEHIEVGYRFDHLLLLFRESAESREIYLQNIVFKNETEDRLRKAIEAADSFAAKMEEAGFPCFFPELI